MKSILIMIACVTALPFAMRANELNDMLHSKDYTCWKCDAKIQHVCPACHGHVAVNPFGRTTQDGPYVRVCSGCGTEPNNCCQPKNKK